MIKLNANIKIIDANGQSLSGVSNNLSKNNISSDIGAIKGKREHARNPFIIGQSKIGDGSTLSCGENYFIGNQLTNADKSFTNSYTITISGSNINHFTISFDDYKNIFPTMIKVDGVDYANDDALFTVGNLTSADTHTIIISNLNTANAVLVITGITIGLSIEINDRNLLSLSRKISDRADIKYPSWGIISNIGDIEFNDNNGEIKEYAEMLLLKQGLTVIINIQDTISDKSQKIGEFITDTWSYDNDSKVVSLSLQDELLEWQDIRVNNYSLKAEMTMGQIYSYLHSITPSKYRMTAFSDLDSKTKNILTSTICEYPYLDGGNLWNEWQKVCEVCALHIYKTDKGSTTCTYDFRG